MSEQRADFDAIEKRLRDHTRGITAEDITYLLAKVRRYEAALRALTGYENMADWPADWSDADIDREVAERPEQFASFLVHLRFACNHWRHSVATARDALADDAQPPSEEKA